MITLDKAAAITRAKVGALRPDFAARVRKWLLACASEGIRVYIYCGTRTMSEQAALFEFGRSKPGPVLTQWRPGQSFHNFGRAIDWVPLIPHPKNPGFYEAGWDATDIYFQAIDLARPLKLKSLSSELPHLQDGEFRSHREIPPRELVA